MIKRFIDHNYGIKSIDRSDDQKSIDHNDDETSSRGPTVLYCAPSNKAVNVGACMLIITAQNIYIVKPASYMLQLYSYETFFVAIL